MNAIPSFDQLFAIPPGQEYRTQNLLHFKPISARIHFGINSCGIALNNAARPNSFAGKVVHVLALGITRIGYVLNACLACAEMIAMFALSLLAIPTGYSLKLAQGGVHSYSILCDQIEFLCRNIFIKDHVQNSRWDQSRTIEVAAIMTKRPHVLLEGGADALRSMIRAGTRDLGMSIPILPDQQFVIQYFRQHPQARQQLANATTRTIHTLVANMSSHFVRQLYFPTQLASVTEQEKAYQERLMQYVKDAFLEIYNTDALACFLDDGKAALEGFYPHIYLPLAYFAQMKELEQEDLHCLDAFTSKQLLEYNNRKSLIMTAQKELDLLQEGEKPLLLKRLLQGHSFSFSEEASDETKARINSLYEKIGTLAGQLHQGSLMSQDTFDIETLTSSSQNFFQKACQEACQEAVQELNQ